MDRAEAKVAMIEDFSVQRHAQAFDEFARLVGIDTSRKHEPQRRLKFNRLVGVAAEPDNTPGRAGASFR